MPRWGMVIDLRKCIGCATCKEVCIQDPDKPPVARRNVIEKEIDNKIHGQRLFVTMSCMQCEHPPCQDTCPTGATYCRPDGIIDINEDLCIGCGACIVACPYHARSICKEDVIFKKEHSELQEKEKAHTDRIGICVKCNYCSQIVDKGFRNGMKPGEDAEATPLCVRYCIGEALNFGDLDDPESNVSKLIRENEAVRMLEHMETKPKTYYIIK
jgi:phenylacetyl-CoA:acceptor oxidoreductase subunit 1